MTAMHAVSSLPLEGTWALHVSPFTGTYLGDTQGSMVYEHRLCILGRVQTPLHSQICSLRHQGSGSSAHGLLAARMNFAQKDPQVLQCGMPRLAGRHVCRLSLAEILKRLAAASYELKSRQQKQARLLLQCLAQAEHLIDLSMHQHHMPGAQSLNELGGLGEVCMR